MQPAVPAQRRAVWDRRFCLAAATDPPAGATLGPLGSDAALLRKWSDLPAALLRTLPALRRGDRLLAVPHLGYPDPAACAAAPVLFAPSRPAAGAPFFAP